MPVFVDLECVQCGDQQLDQWSTEVGTLCPCGGIWERLWTFTRGPSPGALPDEKCVVYVSEKEGKVQYPGRNDEPVPVRLLQRGYERMEISPAQMGSFERRHGVMNERRHYDRNGRND